MTAKDGRPCKQCGTSEWNKNGACKQCNRNSAKQWREENPAETREYQRVWYLENKERAKESHYEWVSRNPDRHNELSKKWQQENRDKVNQNTRRWRRNNPEKVIAQKHHRRTRKTQAGGSYTAAEWKAVKKHQGGRCLACGKKKKLTADHVVPVTAGGSSNISNIQGLCLSCNSRKGTKTTDYRTKPNLKRWIQEKLL